MSPSAYHRAQLLQGVPASINKTPHSDCWISRCLNRLPWLCWPKVRAQQIPLGASASQGEPLQ